MTESDETHALAERIATSVKEQMGEEGSSRRGFLSRSALAGGTLLALGGGAGIALGNEHEDGTAGNETNGTADEMMAAFDDVGGTDIDVLNYALSLEHLENAFSRQALELFTVEDFVDADMLQGYTEATRRAAFGYVESAAEQEDTHVEVLTQAVELLGGDPAMEGTYEFGVETVPDLLGLGQVLENTGVAAYAGAAGFIESPDLLGAALSIHSVEARHAATMNMLTGDSPFPNAFDPASSQKEVLDAVSQFIVEDTGETTTTTTGNETTAAGNETTTTGNETTASGN